MKKTLLVTLDYAPNIGGVAKYNQQIADSFANDELIVLTSVMGEGSKNVIRKKLLFKFFWPRWVKGIFTIYRTYKKHNCKQIYVSEVLPIGTMVYYLHKVFGIPYILQAHGMDLLQASSRPRKKELAKKIIHAARAVVVNSQHVQKLLSYNYNRDDGIIVYPVPAEYPEVDSVVASALVKKHNLDDKKIILSLGRLVPRKGQDKTLGAMSHVWQANKDAVYVIVGDGPDRKRLETMAAPHGNQVIFTGKVSESQKLAWLSLCDLFVMASRSTKEDSEGFGMVYLEAASFAKPSIAGKAGGAGEAVLDQKTGVLVDPEDIDGIALAINWLLEDKSYAIQLGEQGKTRVMTELTWEEQLKKLKSVLV
jgi:phosphatidyl-myo-inositol dimannoside synthase